MQRRTWLSPLGLVVCLLAAGCGESASDSSAQGDGPGSGSRAVVIVLENREFDEVVGSEEAPYFNSLIDQGALASGYGLLHPSLPNYLAMLGGSTFDVTSNCTDCLASGPNLATQLAEADVSWRAYMGGMPEPCFTEAEAGEYAKKHNPFMYFPSVTSQPDLCERVVPESVLEEDLADRELPEFVWISPGLCDDGHDCPTSSADAYLSRRVPALVEQLAPDGMLAITYDEGTSNASCCGGADGGRFPTLLIGPAVRAGVRLSRDYTPFSMLATLEDRFGLPRLRNAKDEPTLAPAFRD